jgi:hypothetical protein
VVVYKYLYLAPCIRHVVYPFLAAQSCHGCLDIALLSWLSCGSYLDIAVSCHGFPILSVLNLSFPQDRKYQMNV